MDSTVDFFNFFIDKVSYLCVTPPFSYIFGCVVGCFVCCFIRKMMHMSR